MKFYVTYKSDLIVEDGNETDVLVCGSGFMQTENRVKAANYLKSVADELTRAFDAGDMDKVSDLIEEAENKVNSAKTAEKFMEEVSF